MRRGGTRAVCLCAAGGIADAGSHSDYCNRLQHEYNGRLLRAASIAALTPSWGRGTMGQQETQAAIYVFSADIDYEQQLIVNYGMDRNSDWQKVIPKLQVERGKISSRMQKD